MTKITIAATHFAACLLMLASASPSQADTLKCGTVSIKDGKAVFSVTTVSATRCAKGSELIVNTSELSRQIVSSVPPLAGSAAGGALSGTYPNPNIAPATISALSNQILSSVPPLAGTTAGGALSGTYPNPDIAPGTIGPSQLSVLPGFRLTRTNTAVAAPSNIVTLVSWDTVSYDTTHSLPATSSYPSVPLSGMYLVTGVFSWSASTDGSRHVTLGHNGYVGTQQTGAPAPTQPTVQTISMLQRFVAGENVTMYVLQDSAGALNSTPGPSGEHASLTVQWVGP